jgi:hypothetical protein
MIKNSLASMFVNQVVMLHLSCLNILDFEFGCDPTSFFSRSDDRLKLEEKLALRVCRIEN